MVIIIIIELLSFYRGIGNSIIYSFTIIECANWYVIYYMYLNNNIISVTKTETLPHLSSPATTQVVRSRGIFFITEIPCISILLIILDVHRPRSSTTSTPRGMSNCQNISYAVTYLLYS